MKIAFRELVERKRELFSAQPRLTLQELRDKYKKWLAVEADAHLFIECTNARKGKFAKMSGYTDAFREPVAPVPVPAAYSRQVSFGYSKNVPEQGDPNVYVKRDIHSSSSTEGNSLKEKDEEKEQDQEGISTGKPQKSLVIFLHKSRIYIRVAAILIMLVSFSLVLTAVIMFGRAQKKPGHPLDNIPQPAPITDHPCIVFTGVAVMNFLLSVTVLSLGCMSSKFNKSNNAINAVFAIVSAIGFSSAMGACFFLNKESTLQNDLWKWSCGNHKKGIVSEALDFNLVCHVVSYGWKFGLVQASLELLTFVISIVAFTLLKYAYFARYGAFGKMF